jgi:5-methylcytosine-specific restriction endonuclease McrA
MSIPARLRQDIARQARHRCGYCQIQEVVSGIRLTLEHIQPKARGGTDDEENLSLSCRSCNEKKGVLTERIDPLTNKRVPLYNPRSQEWLSHFAWSHDGTLIIVCSHRQLAATSTAQTGS